MKVSSAPWDLIPSLGRGWGKHWRAIFSHYLSLRQEKASTQKPRIRQGVHVPQPLQEGRNEKLPSPVSWGVSCDSHFSSLSEG